MICEGAYAHVRCAVARFCVRAKFILESVRDVRACGPFISVQCAIALLHLFAHFLGQNCQKMLHYRTSFPVLEHLFLFWIILFCFRTSYSILEHHILLTITIKILKSCWKKFEKLMKKEWKVRVRCEVRPIQIGCAHLDLDVRGAYVRPKKWS